MWIRLLYGWDFAMWIRFTLWVGLCDVDKVYSMGGTLLCG